MKIIRPIKENLLFILLFCILLVLLFLRLFLQKKSEKIQENDCLTCNQKTPQSLEKTTGSEKIKKMEEKEPNFLNLVSTFPSAGVNQTFFDRYKIIFTFSQILEPGSLNYQIIPKIPLKTSFEYNTVSFYPERPFNFNLDYFLEILTLKSVNGFSLQKPIKYYFQLTTPQGLNFDGYH